MLLAADLTNEVILQRKVREKCPLTSYTCTQTLNLTSHFTREFAVNTVSICVRILTVLWKGMKIEVVSDTAV